MGSDVGRFLEYDFPDTTYGVFCFCIETEEEFKKIKIKFPIQKMENVTLKAVFTHIFISPQI